MSIVDKGEHLCCCSIFCFASLSSDQLSIDVQPKLNIENRSCRSCLIGLSLSQSWFLGRTVQQTNCLHWCVRRLRMPWGWHDLQSSNEFIIFKNKMTCLCSNVICSGNRVKTTRWKRAAGRPPCFQLPASELLAEQLWPEVKTRGHGQTHRLRGRRREGGDPGQPHLDPGEDNQLLLKFANFTFQNLFFNEHNRIASHLFSALKVTSLQLWEWAKTFTSATYSGKARWAGSWRKSLSGWPVFLFPVWANNQFSGYIILASPFVNLVWYWIINVCRRKLSRRQEGWSPPRCSTSHIQSSFPPCWYLNICTTICYFGCEFLFCLQWTGRVPDGKPWARSWGLWV